MGKFGIIRAMINYTKKWWLLGCHRRAERHISTTGSNDGGRVLISQDYFINGLGEHKGLINKFSPYVRFRLSWFLFWEKEYSDAKLKIKRHAYNDLYEVCVREGYISKEKVEVTEFPTVANDKAYNISGFPFGYLQGLFQTYDKVWWAVITIVVALIGSAYFASKFTKADAIGKTAPQAVQPIVIYVQSGQVQSATGSSN